MSRVNDSLWHVNVTRDELAELIRRIAARSFEEAWIWGEAPDGWTLAAWMRDGVSSNSIEWRSTRPVETRALTDVASFVASGRIFCSTGEMQWRSLSEASGGPCRVTLIAEDDWTGGWWKDPPEALGPRRYRRGWLWGIRSPVDTEHWVELNIPHWFNHPVDDLQTAEPQRRVQIVGIDYLRANGRVQANRLARLQEEIDPEHVKEK